MRAWQSQKIPIMFLQSCIAFGKNPDIEEGMSTLHVRMQPCGWAWSKDFIGNFEIDQKEVSM